MLAVKGLFDGKNIQFLEKININHPKEVIITFLDTPETEFYKTISKLGAFDFLNDPDEDIYSDKDLKFKYPAAN